MKLKSKILIVASLCLTLALCLFISNNIYASENIENTDEYKQGYQAGIDYMKKEYTNSLAFINQYNISNIHLEYNNLCEDYDTSYLTTYNTYNSLRLDFKYVYLDWVEYISTDYLPECHITFTSPIPCYGIDDFMVSSSIFQMVFELDNGSWVYGFRYEKESGSDKFYIDTTPLRDLTNLIQQVYIILDDITLPTGVFLDFIKEEYNSGYNYGYNNGYFEGQSDYEISIHDKLDSYYNNGYNTGLNTGYNNGYNEGYNTAYDSIDTDSFYDNGYNEGYNKGYNTGLNESGSNVLGNALKVVVASPFDIFKRMFDFDIFGINIHNLVFSILTMFVAIWFIKKFML